MKGITCVHANGLGLCGDCEAYLRCIGVPVRKVPDVVGPNLTFVDPTHLALRYDTPEQAILREMEAVPGIH